MALLTDAKTKKILDAARAEGIEPCCPLDILDESAKELNTLLKWLVASTEALALAQGVTLPTKPQIGARVVLSMTAGWGNKRT
jgi:hypothetical protein